MTGLRLAGVLPTSQTILAHDLPLHCTPDGVYAVSGQNGAGGGIVRAEDFNFISFDDLASIKVDGKNISLNDTVEVQTPCAASARFIAEFITKLPMLRPSDRRQKIKAFLADTYDLAAIGKIAKSIAKYFWTIKFLSTQLFVLVFLILPAALYSKLSDFVNFSALSICIGIIYFLLIAAAYLTEKKLAGIDAELKACALPSIIISPVNALHVMSYLTRNLYFRFNYLALAAYFMPRDAFRGIIRKEILLVDFFENKNDRQDWQIFWQLKKELLQDLLVKCEISMDELSTPPEKKDQTAVSYCPLCLSEYSEKRHNCIDCEMALKEFSV